MHDFGDHGGGHDEDDVDEEELAFYYKLENVSLTTIGVDVGSSTFHMMFAHIHLRREQQKLSSRFEVVSREILWRSPIELTPYRGRRIDAEQISAFVAAGHLEAGIRPEDVDSGAVILTGEALRRENARALADGIAAGSGKFVCVSAGHHLEAMLAAFGSGAVQAAAERKARLLHVDIGGGTTKLSVIEPSGVRQTAALLVGGRVVAWDKDRTVRRISAGARPVARAAGVELAIGSVLSETDAERLAEELASVILAVVAGARDHPLEHRLRLTPALKKHGPIEALSFSGGVSEYIYERESGEYGDLGPLLARAVRDGLATRSIDLPVVDPGQGIRATVIGAAQASVQLSGNTVTVTHPELLPVRNVAVIHPILEPGPLSAALVASAIETALSNHGMQASDPVALAFSWNGDFAYPALRALAEGIDVAARQAPPSTPLVVLIDADIGASIGYLLLDELSFARPLVCLDGLTLSPLDYVDVGAILQPSGVLPVVIKSLLFDSAHEGALPLARAAAAHHRH